MREMPGLAGVRSKPGAAQPGRRTVRGAFGFHDFEPDDREARRRDRDLLKNETRQIERQISTAPKRAERALPPVCERRAAGCLALL
jgi:hypothetical protein